MGEEFGHQAKQLRIRDEERADGNRDIHRDHAVPPVARNVQCLARLDDRPVRRAVPVVRIALEIRLLQIHRTERLALELADIEVLAGLIRREQIHHLPAHDLREEIRHRIGVDRRMRAGRPDPQVRIHVRTRDVLDMPLHIRMRREIGAQVRKALAKRMRRHVVHVVRLRSQDPDQFLELELLETQVLDVTLRAVVAGPALVRLKALDADGLVAETILEIVERPFLHRRPRIERPRDFHRALFFEVMLAEVRYFGSNQRFNRQNFIVRHSRFPGPNVD
ncbi:hypothetical protein Y033_5372 [Burkholderia pseudomallei MSHR435]|nr:hypothetical protein Y033_5372 [Burkholderia pseudomallei MSHR435]